MQGRDAMHNAKQELPKEQVPDYTKNWNETMKDDEKEPEKRSSWAERRDNEEHELRMEAMTERFRKGAQVSQRPLTHDLDACCRRPVPTRPMSAPVRLPGQPGTYSDGLKRASRHGVGPRRSTARGLRE